VTPVTSRLVTTIQPWRQTTWSTSVSASGVASLVFGENVGRADLDGALVDLVRRCRSRRPLTVIVAPGQADW